MPEGHLTATRLTGRAAAQYRYNHSPKGKARNRKYRQRSRKQAECSKRWRATSNGEVWHYLNNRTPQYRLKNRLRAQEKRQSLHE